MRPRPAGVLLSAFAVLALSAPVALAKQPPGDPPGNNGTIKVVASDPSDPDPGNEPQIDGCLVWLEFYGFDLDQDADITFQAQPPTGDGDLLKHTALISNDAAGGGQDDDEVLAYNLTTALMPYQPHPQQGYHVKVTSDSHEAPGGAKQKVFWLNCAPAPAGTLTLTKATEGGTGGPFRFAVECNHAPLNQEITLGSGESKTIADVPAGTTCVATETDNGGATSTSVAETPADDAADGKVVVPGGQTVTVAVTNLFGAVSGQAAGASPPATEVAGVTETRSAAADGSALPRTGTSPWALTAVASLLMAAGSLTRTGARRYRRIVSR
jgi:hypothetical protein